MQVKILSPLWWHEHLECLVFLDKMKDAGYEFQTGSYACFNLNRSTMQITQIAGTFDAPLQNIRFQSYGDQKTSLQFFLNYDRAFAKHNISANLICTRDSRENRRHSRALSAPYANQGLIFNFT